MTKKRSKKPDSDPPRIMPYSAVVGQERLKLALELAYVAPRLGGVLLSGERGTAKSTTVRAFSWMVRHELPVTLPINATEDRVVGGWKVDALMRGAPERQQGLLQEAGEKGMLYIDEVNLLDDHIVNIILDVCSTGILVNQRDGGDDRFELEFTLVGTMNPEEGGLRPQLLDRFGLIVDVRTETELRERILLNVLKYDEALAQEAAGERAPFLEDMRERDRQTGESLERARSELPNVTVPRPIIKRCVALADRLGVDGHRGERVLALAARAHAALKGRARVTTKDLRVVAPFALSHRFRDAGEGLDDTWRAEHERILDEVL